MRRSDGLRWPALIGGSGERPLLVLRLTGLRILQTSSNLVTHLHTYLHVPA